MFAANVVPADGDQVIVELVNSALVPAVVTRVAPVTGDVTPAITPDDGLDCVAGKRIVRTPVEVLNVALDTPLAVK